MSILKSIKGTFQSVQHDINASWKSLTSRDHHRHDDETLRKLSLQGGVNLDAGADLLNVYQQHWMNIHNSADDSAKQAQAVDVLIQDLFNHFEKQHEVMNLLKAELDRLPTLVKDIEEISTKIGKLGSAFEDTEKLLVSLEDTVEDQDLERDKVNHHYQLALYKEKKKVDLDQVKVQLSKEHADRVKQYELTCQAKLKERQEAFEQAFEEDMQHYKIYGQTQRQPSVSSQDQPDLSEITLDDQDDGSLNEFLSTADDVEMEDDKANMADGNADQNEEEQKEDEAKNGADTEDIYLDDDIVKPMPERSQKISETSQDDVTVKDRSNTAESEISVHADRETQEGFIEDDDPSQFELVENQLKPDEPDHRDRENKLDA